MCKENPDYVVRITGSDTYGKSKLDYFISQFIRIVGITLGIKYLHVVVERINGFLHKHIINLSADALRPYLFQWGGRKL